MLNKNKNKKSSGLSFYDFDASYVLTCDASGKVIAKIVGPQYARWKPCVWVPKSLVASVKGPKQVWVPKSKA